MDLALASTYSTSSGILKQEILRPNRVFSTDYVENLFLTNGKIQTFTKRKRFDLDQENLLFLDKSWKLYSGCGFMNNANQTWILPSFSFPFKDEFVEHFHKELNQHGIKSTKHLNGFYFVFTNVGYTNYYHVLTELLPRLEFFLPFKGKMKLLVSESQPFFLKEAFQLLGIDEHDIQVIKHGIEYSADAFVTIPWGMNFIPERFNFLKNALGKTASNRKKRLYISRKNEKTRHILNETELLPLLDSYGFEYVETQNLSLNEQIRLFSESDFVISPHGAGLANMLWMEKPAFLEIRPENYENECMSHLALVNGAHQINTFFAKSVDQNMNMMVDLEQFKKALVYLGL